MDKEQSKENEILQIASSSKLNEININQPPNPKFEKMECNLTVLNNMFLISDYREFLCGWGASVINVSITFPINKIIFRQMLHGSRVSSAIRELSSEGMFVLYRGILPPLCQKSISSALMFGLYENVRVPLINCDINVLLANAIAAGVAGNAEAVLTPFERVQTLLQNNCYNKNFKNMKHAFHALYAEHGVKELYRGLVPILWRNGPTNFLFFTVRDYAVEHLPDTKDSKFLNFLKNFFIGAVIGAINSTLVYPLNTIKVHMQSKLGGPFQSISEAGVELYELRGRKLRYFFRGVHMNYTRAFISWGVINVAYEKLKISLWRL